MISFQSPQRKWASSRLEGTTSWIFSSCGRCSGLTMGTSGTHPGALRKGQSPWELLWGLSGFLSSADMDLGVLLESPQGSQSSSRVGACTCAFLPSCSSSVTPPFAWIKGSVATTEFSKCAGILSAALSQHYLSGFETAQLEFHHLPFSL